MMEKTRLRFFLRRRIRSYLYTGGGGAASGPEGPQRRRHFGTFPETRFRSWGFCLCCCWATVSPGRMSVIDHVRDMAAAGLHSNVRLLSSLLLTMSNNNP